MQNNIENFEQVWNDSRRKILNLEIDDLTKILSSKKLKNGSQQTVWQVIHDWVIADKKDRLTHLPKLLKENLQFDRLTKHFIEENIFKNVIFMFLPLNFQTDLQNFVENVKFQDELINERFNLPNLSPVINYCHQKLLCFDTYNGYLETYDHQYNSWHPSSLLLQQKDNEYKLELSLLGNLLYKFEVLESGSNQMRSRDLNDPLSQWKIRAAMKQNRKLFSSVVLNDTIYVLGGLDTNDHFLLSCERYDSQLNQWSTVANMNSDCANASAAVINGCIYIASSVGEKSVEKYDPQTDTWSKVAPMTIVRFHFALTPFAGRLWVIGGMNADNHPLSSCESYDLVTDTWREEAPMKKKRCNHAAIEFNGELYVVGGGRWIDETNQEKIVEKYVLGCGWTEIGEHQKYFIYPKLISVPSVCANYFSQT